MATTRQTMPRQNYHEESEAGVNRQINLELYASYVYQSMVNTSLVSFHPSAPNRPIF